MIRHAESLHRVIWGSYEPGLAQRGELRASSVPTWRCWRGFRWGGWPLAYWTGTLRLAAAWSAWLWRYPSFFVHWSPLLVGRFRRRRRWCSGANVNWRWRANIHPLVTDSLHHMLFACVALTGHSLSPVAQGTQPSKRQNLRLDNSQFPAFRPIRPAHLASTVV